MKLPRRRRKAAPETAEPASASPAVPVLQVLIFSNTDLPEPVRNRIQGLLLSRAEAHRWSLQRLAMP